MHKTRRQGLGRRSVRTHCDPSGARTLTMPLWLSRIWMPHVDICAITWPLAAPPPVRQSFCRLCRVLRAPGRTSFGLDRSACCAFSLMVVMPGWKRCRFAPRAPDVLGAARFISLLLMVAGSNSTSAMQAETFMNELTFRQLPFSDKLHRHGPC
jgi:hypothetical protein